MARGVRRQAGLAVAVGILATSCTGSARQELSVRVNDRPITVPNSSAKVGDVLAKAGIQPQPGMIRAIVSGRPIQPNGNPPVVRVDGKRASLASSLAPDDTVVTDHGVDTLEPIEVRDAVGPAPGGAPDVERTLYHPGQPRKERAWVGHFSGEKVASFVVQPEMPSQPMQGPVVALTFDDGPWPGSTQAVLDILREEGVRATFCMVGVHGQEHPELVKAVVDAGHVICNHTVNHRILTGKPYGYVYSQIAGGSEFLTSITGAAPELFRAPSGQVSPDVVAVAHSQGMRVLGWNVESNDYQKAPTPTIVQRVLESVKPGSIILLHDGGGDRSATVAAVRPIIAGLKARGYSFVTPVSPLP